MRFLLRQGARAMGRVTHTEWPCGCVRRNGEERAGGAAEPTASQELWSFAYSAIGLTVASTTVLGKEPVQ